MNPKELRLLLPESWQDCSPILIGTRGSIAHGTNLPTADVNATEDIDKFAIVVFPLEYYFGREGYAKSKDSYEKKSGDLDLLVFEYRKWFNLAMRGNPNSISWLWNAIPKYDYIDPLFRDFFIARGSFLNNNKTINALVGYSLGQRKKLDRQSKYEGFMGDRRRKLADKYGYDLKFAAHAWRLLMVTQEVLKHGTMHTYRPDNEILYIKKIKTGLVPYEEFISEYDRALKEVRMLEKVTFTDGITKSSREVYTANLDILSQCFLENFLSFR